MSRSLAAALVLLCAACSDTGSDATTNDAGRSGESGGAAATGGRGTMAGDAGNAGAQSSGSGGAGGKGGSGGKGGVGGKGGSSGKGGTGSAGNAGSFVPPPSCTNDDECDDDNPCTDQSCDSGGKCQYSDNTASCDDGNACTTADACAAGACQGAATCGDGCDTACAEPIETPVAAGGTHTCARKPDGAIRCWGYNDIGQLGYPPGTTPGGDVDVGGPVVQLALGAITAAPCSKARRYAAGAVTETRRWATGTPRASVTILARRRRARETWTSAAPCYISMRG